MTIVVGGVSPRPVSGFRAAAVVSEIDSRLGLRRRAARRVRRVVAAAPGTRPGWVPTDSMPYGVSEHTATLLFDGRVLVAGGRDVSTVSQFAHIYDPTTSRWSRTGPMWSPRYEHTATLLSDGSVLAAGGFGAAGVVGGWGGDGGDGPAALAYVDRYDPTEGRWHQVADMNAAHAAHTATLLADGTVLVGGGLKSSGFPIGVDRMTSDLVEI
jgi:Galactose oxidase, central domain